MQRTTIQEINRQKLGRMVYCALPEIIYQQNTRQFNASAKEVKTLRTDVRMVSDSLVRHIGHIGKMMACGAGEGLTADELKGVGEFLAIMEGTLRHLRWMADELNHVPPRPERAEKRVIVDGHEIG